MNGGGEEKLLRLVEELKRDVAEKVSAVRGNLDGDMASLASLDVDCMAERAQEMMTVLEERLERNITVMQQIMTGLNIPGYPAEIYFVLFVHYPERLGNNPQLVDPLLPTPPS